MSAMSKTLLKIISAVLAIYILVAAIPIIKQVLQNGDLASVASTTPSTSTSTSIPATWIPVTPTSTEVVSTITPEGSTATSLPDTSTVENGTATPDASTATPLPSTSIPEAASLTPGESNVEGISVSPTYTYTTHLPLIQNGIGYLYQEQQGVPVFTQNFSHSDAGCNWLSVAGQVFDSSGNPVVNLIINVQGTLNGNALDLVGMTGLSTDYGPGGYEIQLASSALASQGTLTIQVFDLKGNALSAKIPFNTSADCSQNVVLINFAP